MTLRGVACTLNGYCKCMVKYGIQGAKNVARNFFEGEIFQKKLQRIFYEADIDHNGLLDKHETYTLVLHLYLLIAQKTMVVARHIPSKEDVVELIKLADIKNSGTINYKEFKKLCLYLCEGVAVQLITQLVFTILVTPFLAIWLLHAAKWLLNAIPTLQLLLLAVPGFLLSDKIGVMMLAPMLNFLLFPYILEYVFLVLAQINPNHPKFEINLSKH
eukprot:CAMPEP_0185038692 /NCGR_PEP_ID=MMETSP1103-20130426/34666_1 /TAXON_ID=36769 /ORGANISM="Paraphysomonas bandaiensis, Strain Caron Lab Isolate" /LENGTH=215 /DNA_ID=CAMNT_0027577239 /DNA_START=24 /DNA_END=668 /DNA_ORIENTATION=+